MSGKLIVINEEVVNAYTAGGRVESGFASPGEVRGKVEGMTEWGIA